MNPAPPLYTRTFWTACALHLTGAMAHAMLLLLPLFVLALGGDELTIGLVLGTGAAASVALRPAVGLLLDRVGRRRVLLAAGALNAASLPLFLGIDSVGVGLYVLTAVHLVVSGALFAAYFTYVADLVPAGRRVEGIAIFGVAGMAPNGLGPALGEVLIARTGYEGLFLGAAAFALVSLALTVVVPEPRGSLGHAPAAGSAIHDAARLLRRGGLGRVLLATVLFGAGINAAFLFVAPFALEVGLRAAPFFAAYATTTIVLRIFGRRLPDRLGPHPIAIPSFAVFALGLALLCFVPYPGVLVLAGIACGAGHGSLFPVLNGLAVARTPLRLHGTVVSLYTAAIDGGGVVGVPLCGAVARAAGYRAMFALMALASLGGLGLLMADRRRHVVTRALGPAAAVLLTLVCARPAPAARWPALVSGRLEDNSFLLEEAYNQEAGVVQHIVTALRDQSSGGWVLGVTQEWPALDERHQLSFTLPYAFPGTAGEPSGVGDVLLSYRYGALVEGARQPAVTPRLSLLLPTGSVRDGLGTGSAGVQVGLPASKQLGPIAIHANLGASFVPHALAPRGRSELLAAWSAGGSVVWALADAINPLLELVVLRDQEVGPRSVVTRTHAFLSPGVRVGWNAPSGVQLVWGIAAPIGLTRDSADLGILLYLSLEHAVTGEALAERRW